MILGGFWGALDVSWGTLGSLLVALGALLGSLGALLGRSWAHVGASWRHLAKISKNMSRGLTFGESMLAPKMEAKINKNHN